MIQFILKPKRKLWMKEEHESVDIYQFFVFLFFFKQVH